jgi:hypothetical protein
MQDEMWARLPVFTEDLRDVPQALRAIARIIN